MARTKPPSEAPMGEPTNPQTAESPPSPTLPAESDTFVYGKYLKCIKYFKMSPFGRPWKEEEDLQLLYLRSKRLPPLPYKDIKERYLEGRNVEPLKKRCKQIENSPTQMNSDDQEALERVLEETGRRLEMEPVAAEIKDNNKKAEIENNNKGTQTRDDDKEAGIEDDNKNAKMEHGDKEPEMEHDDKEASMEDDNKEAEMGNDDKVEIENDNKEARMEHVAKKIKMVHDDKEPEMVHDDKEPEMVRDDEEPEMGDNDKEVLDEAPKETGRGLGMEI